MLFYVQNGFHEVEFLFLRKILIFLAFYFNDFFLISTNIDDHCQVP